MSTTIATKRLYRVLAIIMLLAVMVTVTACFDGPNSSTWRMSKNVKESSADGIFTISVDSADRGTRNRTFNLNTDDLASINVNSSSNSGEIILVISQDGLLDGTEIRQDISNFDGDIKTTGLNPGRIRFSLNFDTVQDSETTIKWR
ncbi:MAG: hypothetical protein LBC73_09730 [Oscillospiraceae bacterium]|nr:hypothetical protein [Oscillospiraceae bacterium]